MRGEHNEALALADEALALDIFNAEAREQYMMALNLEKRKRAQELNLEGVDLFKKQQYREAMGVFRNACSVLTGEKDVALRVSLLTNYASVLNMMEEYGEALQVASDALTLDAAHAKSAEQWRCAHSGLRRLKAQEANAQGVDYYMIKDYAKALECFTNARLHAGNNKSALRSSVLVNLASTLNALERYDEALRAVDELLAMDASHVKGREIRVNAVSGLKRRAMAINKQGLDAFELHEYETALWYFKEAFDAVPREDKNLLAAYASNQAHALNMLRRYEEARQKANEALALSPSNANALNHRNHADKMLNQMFG